MADPLLIAELRRDEGERKKPYRCTAGKLSIGVGRNLDDVGISDDEIAYLLANDIERVRADLDRRAAWWRSLDPVRQRVLQNMCFQLGWPRLSGFKKFLAAAKAGRWAEAATQMLDSKWARDDSPARAQRLAKMMRSGEA
jgi:lysozyme